MCMYIVCSHNNIKEGYVQDQPPPESETGPEIQDDDVMDLFDDVTTETPRRTTTTVGPAAPDVCETSNSIG